MARKKEIPEGVRVCAFKFAVDSKATPGFDQKAESHAGGARRAYNWMLWYARNEYDKWVADGKIGKKPSVSHINLRNAWNEHKNEVGAGADVDLEAGEVKIWWSENSKQIYDAAAKNLNRAYSNWWNPELKAGPPKRKKKNKSKQSFQFFEHVKIVDHKHIQLPKIGVVKVHESLRKLIAANPIEIGTTTVSKDSSGRWFISMTVYLADEREYPCDLTQDPGVCSLGIDLGVKTLATVCNDLGEVVWVEPNPKHLDEALVRLRRAEKALARSRKNSEYGGRYQKKLKKKQRIHAKVRNQRRDAQHKFTTKIAKANPDVLLVGEALHVKGM
ncbi:MAG: RNA-guided endonuclease TnpB family protein, partial [Nitrososphaera sp.]|nr:RNA-guided endonuclease TnpB family protein [Nitrososphaera sp.]